MNIEENFGSWVKIGKSIDRIEFWICNFRVQGSQEKLVKESEKVQLREVGGKFRRLGLQ